MSQFLMDTNAESPAAPPRLPKTRGLHGLSSMPRVQGGHPAHISISKISSFVVLHTLGRLPQDVSLTK